MEQSEFICKIKDILDSCGFSKISETEYSKEASKQVVVASMMINGKPMQQVADSVSKMVIEFAGQGVLSDDNSEEFFELLSIKLEKDGGYSELNESFYYEDDDLNRFKAYCETFFQ